MPKVSVLLPTFNAGQYIGVAIQSVLNQSFEDFELIVLDDASVDATQEIIKKFLDKRIRYVQNEKNLYIQKNLNKGLALASGQYIARIDADDEWADVNKLAAQVSFLDTHADYDLVGTGTIVVNQNREELYRFLPPLSDTEIRQAILSGNQFTHASVVLRKSAATQWGGYNEACFVEDYDLWLKIGQRGKFANLPIYGVKLMVHPESVTSKKKVKTYKETLLLTIAYKKHYPGFFKAFIRGLARLVIYGYWGLSRRRLKSGAKTES